MFDILTNIFCCYASYSLYFLTEMVRRGEAPDLLALRLLLHPGLLNGCHAELCQEVHHSH